MDFHTTTHIKSSRKQRRCVLSGILLPVWEEAGQAFAFGGFMEYPYYNVTIKCNSCGHLNKIVLRKGSAATLKLTCSNCGLPAHTQRIILSENVWTEPKPVK